MPTVGAGRDEAVSDVGENSYICRIMADYVNIHTHRPTGRCTELRTAGIHPWEAARELAAVRSEGLAGRLGEALAGAQALGETGLDFACSTDREAQTELLRAHLRLARERGLAVVLHCVRAFEPLMNELKACPPPAAIFHGFIGSPEQARRAVGSGWYLSFGMRTFASPRSLEALRTTPHERLFFETDDDPAEIGSVYAAAAAVLGCRVSELQQATEANYRRLFTPRATTGTEACDKLKKNTR